MERQFFNICFFIIIIVISGCSKDSITNSKAVTPEDILTKDDEISGWKRSGESWTANSSGELNTYIDGEEPVYTRNGFIEAAMQKYEGTVLSSAVTVETTSF